MSSPLPTKSTLSPDQETTEMIARWLFERFGIGFEDDPGFDALPDELRAKWLRWAQEVIALRSL